MLSRNERYRIYSTKLCLHGGEATVRRHTGMSEASFMLMTEAKRFSCVGGCPLRVCSHTSPWLLPPSGTRVLVMAVNGSERTQVQGCAHLRQLLVVPAKPLHPSG